MFFIYLFEFAIIFLFSIRHGDSFRETSSDESLFASLPNSDCMPEVSAVLLECPKKYRSRSYQDNSESKHERKACEPQLMVNIRVNPSFHIEKLEKFLILDEVYDPRKRTKAKILSPYLIELSRGEPVMMYPLQFSKTIKLEDANNKECDEGAHHNMGNYMTDESGNNGNGNDGLNPANNDKDEHGPEEAQCQHNEHTTKCDEMLESSGAQSTQSTYSSCKTSTERPSTCMPLTARPPNKCSTNQLSPEDESLNRVMQKIHQSFAPITKISENRPSGNIKQNHNSKIWIGDPTDFSEIFKRPHDQFDNPFSNTAKSDKYPNVWNKDRFMMHRPFNKKTKAKSKPPHNRVSAVSAIRSKQRKNLLQAKIFDDLSANVGVEKPFAKRLLGNKLAQLGIITSPRAERKVRKKGRVDDIKNAFEDEDDDDGSSTISKDSDYDKLLEKTSEDINNIDKDELPFRDSNTDEKEYRNAEERVDAILRDRKKTNENRKRFQVGRKHHRYRDEKLEEDTAGKANFKSCECKSAPRRGPEESNDRMELKNVEKCVNSQDLEEDNDFKEDPKVDMDESDLLSSSEMQVASLDEKPYKKTAFYSRPKTKNGKRRRMKNFRKHKKDKKFDYNENFMDFNVEKNMREERAHNVYNRSPDKLRRPLSMPIIAGIPLDEPSPKNSKRDDDLDEDDELYYYLNGDHYRYRSKFCVLK
uniref:Uncharacterized protein n=1 Tax=Glossina palpalis gambiensis TaxID=67801 RepID=A0A1B0BB47_9MUSC